MIDETPKWKQILPTVALVLALALTLTLLPARSEAINLKAGMPAPDFTVQTLRGDKVSLHDYYGKVVMVTFWSSWCARCQEEMEFLENMKAKYPSLSFIALNSETDKPTAEDVAKMMQAIKEWKLPLIVAIDDGLKVWDLYQVNALPTSLIIGADGNIIFIEPNFYWASPEKIDNALQSAFGAPAPAAGEVPRKGE